MNRIMKKWQALSVVVYAIAAVFILTILPLRLWQEPIESVSNRIEEGNITLEQGGPVVEQMFVAQYDLLDSLDVLVTNCESDTYFALKVYDENHMPLRDLTGTTKELGTLPARCSVKLNLRTEVGKAYYYTLECLSGSMQIVYEYTETSGFIYSGPCHVGEEALGGCNLITGYTYKQPLRKTRSLLCIVLMAAVAFGIGSLLKYYGKKQEKLSDITTLQWGIKTIFNPLIIVGTIGGMIATGPLYLFSLQYADIAMFTLGVLLCGLTLWYFINRTYKEESDPFRYEFLIDKLPDVLQSVCFAMAVLACIHYMNGLYEVFHDIAYREMLIWLALSMLVVWKRKEIFNLWNLAGVIIAGIWGYRNYRLHLAEMNNEYEVRALKLTGILAVLIVLVAIHTIRIFLERRIRHVNVLYGSATLLMAIGIVVKRNTRWWPVMMVVAFSLYAINYAAWEKKERLLNNVLNGILFNFIGTTAYCLWRRPFMSFHNTRYPHLFHTVTETAAYMAVILAAALVKLLWKYNKEKSWKACFGELTIFSVAACYELFTMSRTGLLAVIAVGLVLWFVMMQGRIKEKSKKMLGSAVMIAVALIWFFPICITAQRIIPALVKQPDQYEIEEFEQSVLVGDDIQSDDYITMDRFLEIFANKMLSVPMDTFNLYQYRIGPDTTQIQEDGPANSRPVPVIVRSTDDGSSEDFTNGRTDIFRSYIEQLTMQGHDDMGAILKDGSVAMHAHNIYLQFAFDHGIIMGILFVLWLAFTGVWALLYYWRKREEKASALPLAMTVLIGSAGLVEWVTHPCNPAGFAFLLVLAPLLFDDMKREK